MTAFNAQSVTSLGEVLLERAALFDTTPVKRELAAFAALHKKWLAAQHRVDEAREKELAVRLDRGQLEAEQDAALEALALALVRDGFDRDAPFKTFKAPAPTALKSLQAEQALALATAVQRDKQTSPATRRAAQALTRAATAVQATGKRLEPALAATDEQRQQRDELLPQWMKAWGVLKLAARQSEASGGPALASALFPATKKPTAPRRSKALAPAVPI